MAERVLIIYSATRLLAWIVNAPLESTRQHIINGYPGLLEAWDAGELRATILEVENGLQYRPSLYAVINWQVVERPDLVLERAKELKRREILAARRTALWSRYNYLDVLEKIVLKYGLEFGSFPARSATLDTLASPLLAAVNNAQTPEEVEAIIVSLNPGG